MQKKVPKLQCLWVRKAILELTIEDTKPLPTTSKGKGPGIKNAQSIIDTGIENRLISQKLIGGNKRNPNVEYSPAPSSLSQGNIETELRKGAKIEQYGPPIPEKVLIKM